MKLRSWFGPNKALSFPVDVLLFQDYPPVSARPLSAAYNVADHYGVYSSPSIRTQPTVSLLCPSTTMSYNKYRNVCHVLTDPSESDALRHPGRASCAAAVTTERPP